MSRVVWSDVRHDVESLVRTVDDLRELLGGMQGAAADGVGEGATGSAFAAFVESSAAFCSGTAATAVAEVQQHHRHAEDETRRLLRYLAVEEKAWARPEEALATLHEVLLAIKQAQRYHALAAERAANAAKRAAGGSDAESGGGSVGGADAPLLVDGVAGRFSNRPTAPLDDQQGSDRSAELLRLLLRRASITGSSVRRPDGGSDDGSDDDEGW